MSVHQESMAHSAHGHEELVVKDDISRDMVTLLLTALGGAIIGTLLTLFVLSAINGGTLRYGGGASRLDAVELGYVQLSENVHANTVNMQSQNEQFATDINSINDVVMGHSRSINQMAPMVARTSANSEQTSVLMSALEEAFGKASSVATGADLMVPEVGGSDAVDGGGDAADIGPMVALIDSTDVMNNLPSGMLTVLPFVDANGSGAMEIGEANEVGITASLIDAGGMTVATVESGDAGFNFRDVASGSYEFVIENGGAFESLVGQSMPIEMGADNGQLIYVGIMDEGVEPAASGDADDDHAEGGDHSAGDADDGDHGEDADHAEEDDGH